MSAPLSFAFGDRAVRVVMLADQPWWVAKDLCRILDIRNDRAAMGRLDEDQKGVSQIDTLGGPQMVGIVNESGMWMLVLRSDKPQAVELRRWLTREVLPTLRKTGRYEMHGRPALPDAAQLMQDHDTTRISVALNVVREARKLFGPQSARLMWMNMGLPAPVASEAPLLFADPMGPDLQAFCETVNECTIEDAASALGITHLDGGMRVRIGKLLRELGWFPLKARRGGRPVNLFAPRHTIEREAA